MIAALHVPELDGARGVGFDLDDRVDDGSGSTTCVEWMPDLVSIDDPGETGIDNQLALLVPSLRSLFVGECSPTLDCFDETIRARIADGSVLVVIEVAGIESFTDDDAVTVQAYAATVECARTVCTPRLSGGALAPGQRFELTPSGAPGSGRIFGGTLEARVDELLVPLPLFPGESTRSRLGIARLTATITADALSGGTIGGSLEVDELISRAVASGRVDDATAHAVFDGMADLAPQSVRPLLCTAFSAGMRFEAILAL